MDIYLIITIDTESDYQWDDTLRGRLSLENIREIPRLQMLFNKLSIKPCYLVTYAVACNEFSVALLRDFLKASICEIGVHLHSWSTPPILDEERGKNPFLHTFPAKIQREKFDNLYNLVVENFGVEPKSYRGGRYSFDTHLLEMLEEKNFFIDSSVTPYHDWFWIGGLDYVDCIIRPYFISKENVLREGDSFVLEVPVSIDFNKNIPQELKKFIVRMPRHLHVQGILKRLNLCKLIWMDPSFQSVSEMKTLAEGIIERQVSPCINLMFHSSVLLEGASPYTRSKNDVESFYQRLEQIIVYLLFEKRIKHLLPMEFATLWRLKRNLYAN